MGAGNWAGVGVEVNAENPTAAESRTARRESRFAATGKSILLMRWGGDGSYDSHRVRLLDCSAHGLGIVDTEPMQPGEQFVVYLQLDEVTMVLYTVRYCAKLESGEYKIGAQLAGFIGKDDTEPDQVLTSLLEHRLA